MADGIHEKLINVQSKLKAPKNQYNNFGKYPYRNCEDILEALKPLLKEEGLTLVLTDGIDVKENGRTYVKAKASLFDGSNELSVYGYAREPESKKGMDDSQVTGASSSYARKYALNGLFLIDDTKDADSMDNTADGATKAQKTSTKQTKAKTPTAEDETRSVAIKRTLDATNVGIKADGIKSYVQTQFVMNKAIQEIPSDDEKFVSKAISKMTAGELNRYIDHLDTLINDKQELKEAKE